MNKLLKKLLSILTALVLFVPLNVPVFAASCNATIRFKVMALLH